MSTFDPKYPIGKYEVKPFSEATKKEWIEDLQLLPGDLEFVCQNMDKAQLDTPYREGGWTVQQLVHHVADSHMNAFARFKLALTEEVPLIKTYDEKAWVMTADVMDMPINYSITLLFALHARWAKLLESLTDEQWQRKLFHPVRNAEVTLWDLFTIYAWHGKHHVAHIKKLKEQKGW
jgi:uncharacterized damage-inducible protein DinB